MAETNAIHDAAARGFSVGADLYVRGRPDYPAEVDRWLRETLGLGPGKRAVDLGAGTGKFTRRLAATGAGVVAIEPVAEMRAKLTAALPEAEALPGTAEAMPLPGESVDAVICAQSFHWFSTPQAMAEIRRVLKPGGRLSLIWNQRNADVPWVARLGELFTPYEGDAPRAWRGGWKSVFPAEGFGPLERQDFVHAHTGSPEDVLIARVLSTSFIAALPPEKQDEIVREVRALVSNEPELAGRPIVTVPYRTEAYTAVRL